MRWRWIGAALIAVGGCSEAVDFEGVEGPEASGEAVEAAAGCECAAAVVGCGHRGAGTNAADNPWPENTVPSLEAAAAAGAEMVEFDVQLSADGVAVLMHDATVERTTDGAGCVGSMTLAELQGLDAAAGTSLAGTGVRVPTLAEALAAVTIGVNVEIKVFGGGVCPASDREALAEAVVTAFGASPTRRRVVVSSFDADVLSAVQAREPSLYLGLLSADAGPLDVAADRGFSGVNLWKGAATAPVRAVLADEHLDLNVWTINDEEGMLAALEEGARMVITDAPEVFRAVRADFCDCE